MQNDPLIKLSVSATTRAKRPQEIEGQHYYFIDQDKFAQMQKNQEFIESATVFDNNYGTPKKTVQDSLKNGNEVLFDIDWQGARQIKEKFDKDSIISIFILPPSMAELERRLKNRASDPEEIVQSRMQKALDEISHHEEYDYILINDDLNATYQKIRAIIDAKRVSRFSRLQIGDFVKKFM
jgi:guanylate kinase